MSLSSYLSGKDHDLSQRAVIDLRTRSELGAGAPTDLQPSRNLPISSDWCGFLFCVESGSHGWHVNNRSVFMTSPNDGGKKMVRENMVVKICCSVENSYPNWKEMKKAVPYLYVEECIHSGEKCRKNPYPNITDRWKGKKYIKKKTVLHLYEEKCLWPSFSPVSIFSILGLSLSSEVPGKMIKIYPTIKKINWKEGRGEGHLQRWNRHGGTNLHLLNLFQTFQTCAFFPPQWIPRLLLYISHKEAFLKRPRVSCVYFGITEGTFLEAEHHERRLYL